MLLSLAMLAAAAATSPPAGAQAKVGVRIVRAARVIAGRSDLPAGRGLTFVKGEDGRLRELRLVEFN